jgi:hypothetical protein
MRKLSSSDRTFRTGLKGHVCKGDAGGRLEDREAALASSSPRAEKKPPSDIEVDYGTASRITVKRKKALFRTPFDSSQRWFAATG